MKFFLFSVFQFLFFIFSASSHAFTLNSSSNSKLTGWDSADIQLLVNTANCPANVDVVGIISAAVEVWNNVPDSKVKVSYGGTTTSTSMASPPTVYCETNFQAVVTGADQNYVPGAAAVNGSTGKITQGILYLNASSGLANIANFDATTLKIILAHEIGHLLGLGHSASTNALMYYDASSKMNLRLSQDDMDGMSYLYPSDELNGDKISGCGLIRKMPPPKSPEKAIVLFLLALPLLLGLALRWRLS